ncbi:response regulator transcription factor [Pelagibaculum spongiae]|uniref:DNA-binding response regulator n=1 Tax=Pelagibaculum spongiae TaxID=2080658 RepID=A0A2V1H2W8_9GAMM|nr:response regulator transcription factor [Pelagibaculum spongiae]PVZ71517.1 DNA-binding response regulator [Pelagibaculum spongiae]
MTKILLVDDHPLVRDGIRARLEANPGLEVIGEAENGLKALELAEEIRPDLVLMDISMPVMNGLEATKEFRQRFPDIKVLILSMHDHKEYILKILQAGASGYLLKEVSSTEMIQAIETVCRGGSYFSPGASDSLFNHFDPSSNQNAELLTPREKTVLANLSEGKTNKEIARKLNISVRTVETHRQNIKSKLGIQTAAGLTRYAIENNLVDLD